jgi:hypothetical protein
MLFVDPGREQAIRGDHGQFEAVFDRNEFGFGRCVDARDSSSIARVDFDDAAVLHDDLRLVVAKLVDLVGDSVPFLP